MDPIDWQFAERFGGYWVKVKFYEEKPNLKEFKRLKNVRFCEATKEATVDPILLDKESISCTGAQYAFGWRSGYKDVLLDGCYKKRQTQMKALKSMLSQLPYFKTPFNYIGLNTEGEPDLVMSYMMPEETMRLINIYHDYKGENLDVSLCSIMAICGGIAVRTYLEKNISLSFGCNDSRKYVDIRKENLAVGIPNRLFKNFLD